MAIYEVCCSKVLNCVSLQGGCSRGVTDCLLSPRVGFMGSSLWASIHYQLLCVFFDDSVCIKNYTISIIAGEDGPSQMALEDLAMFRAIPNATVFYPSDAVSAERAIELAANTKGITYTRTSRPATVSVYKNDESFEIGKCKVWI